MPATYEPIATTTLSTNTATVTFSSISGSYTDLILIIFGRSTRNTNDDTLLFRLNNDSGSNYSRTRILADGTTPSSARDAGQNGINFDIVAGATLASGTYSPNIYHIMNYSNTTTNTTVLNRSNNANAYVVAAAGLYRSTAAITRIDLSLVTGPNFVSGSTFTLYGIKAA